MTAILPSSFLGIVFPCPCRVLTNFLRSDSFVLWESLSEHGSATFRLLFCGFILNHIPVLDQNPVFDSKNVRCNPVDGQAEMRKSSVNDYEVFLSHDRSRFVLQ